MLTVTRNTDGGVTITPGLRSPTVYLDYGVIGRLAGTSTGERLRERICERGTLYLSWAHFIELFSLGLGPTFDRLSTYLTSFGPHFIVIDADSNAVIKREFEWTPHNQNPAIDGDWLNLMVAKWTLGDEEISIGILLDYMSGEPDLIRHIKALHAQHKERMKTLFDGQRHRYRTDRAAKKQLDAVQYPYRRPFVTSKVNLELARECIRTNEQFTLTDGLDFHHAVVSISYCDFVVLDKKWARRCNSVELPRAETAAVFDGTQIDRLIAALEVE